STAKTAAVLARAVYRVSAAAEKRVPGETDGLLLRFDARVAGKPGPPAGRPGDTDLSCQDTNSRPPLRPTARATGLLLMPVPGAGNRPAAGLHIASPDPARGNVNRQAASPAFASGCPRGRQH